MVLRRMVSLVVPASVALVAFLHAHAIGSLVDAVAAPSSIAPFAEARAAANAGSPDRSKSAAPILDRNPFDHEAGPLSHPTDPASAPPCEGVRAVASVHGEDTDASFAALDAGGEQLLRKRGGDVGDMRVVYVARDRVWLERNGVLCQARVFASRPT